MRTFQPVCLLETGVGRQQCHRVMRDTDINGSRVTTYLSLFKINHPLGYPILQQAQIHSTYAHALPIFCSFTPSVVQKPVFLDSVQRNGAAV